MLAADSVPAETPVSVRVPPVPVKSTDVPPVEPPTVIGAVPLACCTRPMVPLPIWLCTLNNCPPLTASVEPDATVPSATLTILRSLPTAPTETVLAVSATDPAPSATALSAVALAPWPMATALAPVTEIELPTATALSAFIALPLPKIFEPAALAEEAIVLFEPIRLMLSPQPAVPAPALVAVFTVLPSPTTNVPSPLTVFGSPKAKEPSPCTVCPVPKAPLFAPATVLAAPKAALLPPLTLLLKPSATASVPFAPTCA